MTEKGDEEGWPEGREGPRNQDVAFTPSVVIRCLHPNAAAKRREPTQRESKAQNAHTYTYAYTHGVPHNRHVHTPPHALHISTPSLLCQRTHPEFPKVQLSVRVGISLLCKEHRQTWVLPHPFLSSR